MTRATQRRTQTRPTLTCPLPHMPTTKTRPSKQKPGTAGPRSAGRLQMAIDATVRREIETALRETDGNVTHTAKALGVTMMALRKRMRAMRIDPNTYRA